MFCRPSLKLSFYISQRLSTRPKTLSYPQFLIHFWMTLSDFCRRRLWDQNNTVDTSISVLCWLYRHSRLYKQPVLKKQGKEWDATHYGKYHALYKQINRSINIHATPIYFPKNVKRLVLLRNLRLWWDINHGENSVFTIQSSSFATTLISFKSFEFHSRNKNIQQFMWIFS